MKVYTTQLSNHRKVKEAGVTLVNTTVKSGNEAFAPSWRMVTLWKADVINWSEYTEMYRNKVIGEQWIYEEAWRELLSHKAIALACYCKPGDNCHRHLLVDIIDEIKQKQGYPITRGGELK